MSAERSGDVSLIQDEDLLRKMWQETEDFGRKKEIRAHMYKLREARLRDFYNSGEVSTEIQRSTKTTSESKSCSASTHADSLADHSFISMKTKEIRDSESPTRDVSYRVSDKGLPNQGWTIVTSNKQSDDGKTFTTSKTATTSGTEKIQGGKLDYAAKNDQQASVYQDGDDKNFTKAVGASSNTFIKQEASGGDENSSFKSSSTKTSSSSKYVSEHRSTSGDIIENQVVPSKIISQNQDDQLVSRKVYTDKIPDEFKTHPSYVDGKTKVTRETRTLPDGTTVTTTKYEIKGGTTSQTSKSNQYSTQQKSSTVSTTQSKSTDSRTNQNESRTTRYVEEAQPSTTTTTVTRHIYDTRDDELQPAATKTIIRSTKDRQVDSVDDATVRSTTVYDSSPRNESTVKTTVVKSIYDTRDEPSTINDTKTTIIRNIQDVNKAACTVDDSTSSTIKTTVVKNIYDTRDQQNLIDDSRTILIKSREVPVPVDDIRSTTTTKTTITKQINDAKDERRKVEDYSTTKINRHEDNEIFIAVEKQDNRDRSEPKCQPPEIIEPKTQRPDEATSPERRPKPQEPYPTIEKRQPIKPGKSELDVKHKPTEGQYETTYRTDFTTKRISVEVSPTHDAFARSLRAVSPDRISKCSSPSRGSLRNSTNSLRSSTSPEKNRHPSRVSPDRRSTSPRKTTSTETITYRNKTNTDTRRTETTDIDSSTLTRRKTTTRTRSRSPSPTTTASEIEFIRNTDLVTDLDTNETTIISTSRPSSLEITKTRKITDRSPTTPLTDATSPKKSPGLKDTPRRSSLRNLSPNKEQSPKSDKPFKRTDTYEERCRQILGITSETDKKKSITTSRRGSAPKTTPKKETPSPTRKSPEKKIQEFPSQVRKSPERKSPMKESPSPTRRSPEKQQYPQKKSPVKESPKISEFPSQIRKSPVKEPLGEYPERKSPVKESPKINEFPSQIRKSPEKKQLGPYPEKKSPTKEAPKVSEFPAQVRKSPEKQPLEPYPERKVPSKEAPKISEFPSQIRKLSEREPFDEYPERKSPVKEPSGISEFPSQIRRSPEKEPLGEYPERVSPLKEAPQICEFPSQIRRSPEREPLEKYPERTKPTKEAPKISEFPSQIPKSSERETPEDYPERRSPTKEYPRVSEFPSQIRKSVEREPLEDYPERRSPVKEAPKISEFPSQIRKSIEREPLEDYPEKTRPTKEASTIGEFPSQIRKSPKTEPLGEYPRRESPVKESPKISEFPSQIRKPTEREPLEDYPEKTRPTKEAPTIGEFPSQIRKSPKTEPLGEYPRRESPVKESPKISEFPSQIRKPTEREPLEDYPERTKPTKEAPKICEFPSQIRKPTEREPLEDYPERTRPTKEAPKTGEFPSQIRKRAEREPLEDYPERRSPAKEAPKICEFPSQIRKPTEREPLDDYPEKRRPTKEAPKINEFPSQIRKPSEREPLEDYPERRSPAKEAPKICEFPSQIRKPTEREPLEDYPEKRSPTKEAPKISEFPSQIRKPSEREPLEDYPERRSPAKEAPSQIRKPSERKPLEEHPERTSPAKETPKTSDSPSKIRKSPEKKPTEQYLNPDEPVICEFTPSVTTSQKEPLERHPENKKPQDKGPQTPAQIKKPTEKHPEKTKPQKETPKTAELHKSPEKSRPMKETKRIPEKQPVEQYPEKTKPKPEKVPSQTKKIPDKHEKRENLSRIYPTSPSKKDKPKQITTSSSSSSTEEDDEETNIEEINTVTKVTELEGKVPVDEPLATKRFINQLCREEEIQRTDLTKKKTQTSLEKEIIETGTRTVNKTVKKDSPRKPQDVFIDKEKKDTDITIEKYSTPRATSPMKKPSEKSNIVTTNKKTTTTTVRTDTKSTKKITDEKTKTKDVKKTSEKITLYDIENLNRAKEDNKIHIRTHRIDDTINKRVTKPISNGDVVKKSPTKRPQSIKPEEPKTRKPLEKKPQRITSKTTVTETESKRITTEQKTTPKRHVVYTTITVSPKTRTTPTKSPSKTVAPKSTKVPKKPKLQNGHVTSDDESIRESIENLTEDISMTFKQTDKISRTISDQIVKKKRDSKTPVRGVSKPEIVPSKTKPEKKCITTKSIIINNEATDREVIVDLQRSKSSREPTPDGVCPLPVSSDDDSVPRYPDHITEPDDGSLRRRPKKLSDIPLLETEDVTEFSRITEIDDTTKIRVDRVEETDESLLSVNKKINKFLDTAEKVTKTPQGPAPKVQRPKIEVDEDLESDECLLSVSEKVNKFITTAEQLTIPQELPQRPKSPKCQYYPDENVSVSDKVAHFITTAEKVVTSQKPSPTKVGRPGYDEVDETSSVTDKVSKFINTEKTSSDTRKISLSKMDVKPTRKPSEPEEIYRKVPSKETTPVRQPPNQYTSIKPNTQESRYPRKEGSPKLPDSTPKSTRRPSEEEPKSVLSPTGRLRSTESVKKAKALFENISKDQQVFKQRDIISRPSVFDGRNIKKTEIAKKLDYESDEEKTLKSTRLVMYKEHTRPRSPEKVRDTSPRRSQTPEGDLPGYMRPLDRSVRPEKVRETSPRRSQTPEGDLPGYMKPLDRSLRPNSPHRDNVNQINQMTKKASSVKDEETDNVRQTKFGVALRRTDSGRTTTTTTTTTTTSKNRASIEGLTESEIEEIYDLEILEELLEKVVGYDLRRKIRAQIRLVKKLISEGKLVEVTTTREKSPPKTTKQTKETTQKSSEYQSSYSYGERRSSSEYTKVSRRSESPLIEPRRSKTPEKSPPRTTKVFQTQLKKTTPSSKTPSEDNTPEWVKQRNLKKVTDSTTVTAKSTSTCTTSKKTRSSPAKETKPTDIITSSYGVGPTDDNGAPLFGLKALRTQNTTDTTKVQGTVIRSQYYSENGQEPVGEISVTKYSSDPRDLGRNEEVKSVTTTQKFGYKDTPSLKSLTKKNKEICDEIEDETTKTTKVTRRGSVKALSQKFIDNAVETSKSERQSSYPKAGLILRTSSFKESASNGDSREGSEERTVTVKTSSSKTVAGETFLSNRSKVTGVQDVITRMKTEDVREGDSIEDVEARGLLNKFIGSQVILSGLESNVKSSTTTTNAKRTTKITTTITEGGKPTTKTRIFQHPITDEELETVWDEQTLRLLLEQSTDYDERRNIRARLRQVMAEQEACTELVEKASQDQVSTTFEGATHTKKTLTEGPVTTSQVTTRVTTQQVSKKPMSPFAKFRQLDKQNSLNSPSTPKTPSGSGPLFKFTDPSLNQSASTIKDRLLHWCRMKTKEYENIQLDNFSTSWADGLAFCALIHHFLPDSFDYHALSPKNRRHNFTLAFQVADEKADIAPLLDVDDMVATRKPDWKCVFTYVQSIYRRFKDED